MDGSLSHRIVLPTAIVLAAALGLLSPSTARAQPTYNEPPLADAPAPARPTNDRPIGPVLTPAVTPPLEPPLANTEPTDPPPPEVTLKVRVAATAAKDRDLVYHLLVENKSPTARAHHVIVRDSLPDNVRYVSATPKPNLEPPTDKPLDKAEVRWELGTLAPLEKKELTLALRPTGGDVRNTARIQFEFGQTVVTRLGHSDLGLKIAGPTTLAVRDKKDFTVTVTNNSQVVATDVTLKALLPPGVLFSLSEPAETGDGTLSWNLGDLQPGTSRRVRLELLADKEGDGVLKLDVTDGGGGTKSATANIVVGQPRLDLQMTAPATRILGSSVIYQITVNSIGTMPATGVVIDYPLPAECLFVSATGSGALAGDHVHWSIGTLKVGEKHTVELTLKLKNSTEAINLRSYVEASADRAIRKEAGPVMTHFEGGPGLSFTVDQSAPQLEVNAPGKYVINVRNRGTAEATEVALVVHLPKELKYENTSDPNARESAGTITFKPLDRLEPGKVARFEVTAKGLVPGEVRVRIELKASQTALVKGEESTHIFGEPPPRTPTPMSPAPPPMPAARPAPMGQTPF
jgi:uncharacterized repeat protein (TIGR01451 family)